MSKLTTAFFAYAVIFAGIFIYTLLLASRQKRLDRKVEELKNLVREGPDRR